MEGLGWHDKSKMEDSDFQPHLFPTVTSQAKGERVITNWTCQVIVILWLWFTSLYLRPIKLVPLGLTIRIVFGIVASSFQQLLHACCHSIHLKAVPSHADTASAAAGAAVHTALQKPNLHPIASTSVKIYHHSPLSAALFPCGQGWGQSPNISAVYILHSDNNLFHVCWLTECFMLSFNVKWNPTRLELTSTWALLSWLWYMIF